MRIRSYADCLLSPMACLGLLLLGADLSGTRANAATLTIKGVITNVVAARTTGTGPSKFTVIWDDSYLQLVLLKPDGGIPVSSDSKGRISSPSSLPKTDMPKKGAFSIVCEDLKPGTYVVAAQKAWLAPQGLAVLQKDRQPVKIEVTERTGPVVDVGDVTIPMNR